jgi:hypothetical protein
MQHRWFVKRPVDCVQEVDTGPYEKEHGKTKVAVRHTSRRNATQGPEMCAEVSRNVAVVQHACRNPAFGALHAGTITRASVKHDSILIPAQRQQEDVASNRVLPLAVEPLPRAELTGEGRLKGSRMLCVVCSAVSMRQ